MQRRNLLNERTPAFFVHGAELTPLDKPVVGQGGDPLTLTLSLQGEGISGILRLSKDELRPVQRNNPRTSPAPLRRRRGARASGGEILSVGVQHAGPLPCTHLCPGLQADVRFPSAPTLTCPLVLPRHDQARDNRLPQSPPLPRRRAGDRARRQPAIPRPPPLEPRRSDHRGRDRQPRR